MLRGLYTAASGLTTQQRRHDIVTNNIANMNTAGFKASTSVNRTFPEMLLTAIGGSKQQSGSIGKLSFGVFAEENMMLMQQGDLFETKRSLDIALLSDLTVDGLDFAASGKSVDENGNVVYQPQALFTVMTADDQLRYTRNGSFKSAPDGTLLTAEGLRVAGANGQPIVVNGSWDAITVAADGRLLDPATGAVLGGQQIGVAVVNNPNDLLREGNGVFSYAGEPDGIRQMAADDRIEVRQGYIERSNVDAAQSAVDLMAALRAYETNQKVIQVYDQSLDKAVNQVGKV